MLPVLYSFRRCPYAMRARFALLYCDVDYEHREILLKNKPRCLLEASPKGTVPVLLLTTPRKAVVDESIDIMIWAYQQKGVGLEKLNIDKKTGLVAKNDEYFKYWLDCYKYADRHHSLVMEDSRAKAAVFVDELEACLHQTSYLSGQQKGFLDFAIMPFVRQFAGVDDAWFSEQCWPKTQRWLAKMCASPLFEQVMTKYSVWQPEECL